MDIFGTITNTIDLANKVVTYVQAVKGAKEDRRKLHSEVSALGDLLKALHNRFGIAGANGSDNNIRTLVMVGIRDPLLRCYEDLGRTVEELERIASPTNTGKKSSSFLERMKDVKWPFQQEDIKTMLARIERLKSLVSFALQASLTEFVRETRNELKNVGLNVEGIEAAVSALETAQKAHIKEAQLLHVNLRSLINKSQDSANDIVKIEDKLDTIDRNQRDHMMKGDRMQADLITFKEGVHNQELEDLVKWLSPLDFSEKHNTIFEKRTRDTGEWFLEHQNFLAWRRGECQMLWCPGNPGVGKSVIASLVINELGEGILENMALVFIYFEYKTKYTMLQLAEVILKQLARRRITQSGLESLRKHKAGNRPTSEKLFNIFKVEVETYDRVFVVIDALDEADTEIWTQLLGRLRPLCGISLIATSRDTGEIEFGLRPYECLKITADEGDVRKYIEGRLESSGKFKRLLEKRRDVYEEIVTGVMKKADGMFLLAQLHMNSLETKLRVTDLRRALDELPNTLDATYDEAISRISTADKALAYRVISWLVYAARPMTIHDLQYALAVEDGMTAVNTDDLHDEASLTSICVGLVVLREDTASHLSRFFRRHRNSKVVGFVHYTTQEYFLHNPSISAQFADSPSFAITCLKFLASGIPKTDGPPDSTETPFSMYAILFWGVHARAHCGDKTVKDLAMELLHDSQRVAAISSFPLYAGNSSAIHLCTHFGLGDYLEYLLDNGYDINSRESDGNTAVSRAALGGQEEIMRLLLAREGVDVNPRNNSGDTPIIIAAQRGHGGIVELLLARGVDVNSRGRNGRTPLSFAAGGGHEAIVRLLLARDDLGVNPCDDDGDTPIISAARGGHSGTVELLLARGMVVNSRGWNGGTLLSVAAGGGREVIVRLLLARGDLDVNPRDDVGDTPIVGAAQNGHSGTVELLLARGVDVNSRGSNGGTLLSVAAGGGREAIVRLLLARDDLDVNPRDDDGNTPIINAAWCGHGGIVELLLARGVDANSRGWNGGTPLSFAAGGGHEAIVQLLLTRDDLDIDSRDDDGNTPIINAVRDGHGGIVELLLARGVDVNSRGSNGGTPLSVAAGGGREVIVQLLLARNDLDVDPRDDDGDTPIINAARVGYNSIVELLLARGVDVNSRGQGGCTPLSVAAGGGYEAIVRLLLARDDLDVDLRGKGGDTSIIGAARVGYSGIVELLLARGVDVNSRGENGDTALSAVMQSWPTRKREATVRLLLANPNLDNTWRDNDGNTYLAVAAYCDDEQTAKLFLAKADTDVNSRNLGGDSPLSLAARRGNAALVKLLLDQDGIEVNPVDPGGKTSLDYSIKELHKHIIEERREYAIARHEHTIELLRAAGGCTGSEFGLKPRKDAGSGGGEDEDTTEV